VESIGEQAFAGCRKLENITFESPSSLKAITQNAFKECTGLTSIHIPNSVESIGEQAFAGCPNLENITFESPSSLKAITRNAFRECTSLTSIDIPSSVESIGERAFCSTGLSRMVIPSGVRFIGQYAFEGCAHLAYLEIPAGVKQIGDSIAKACAKLQAVKVNWPDTGNILAGQDCFNAGNRDCRLFVPRGSRTGYVGWQNFDDRHVIAPHTVSVVSGNPKYGIITSVEGNFFHANGEELIYTWDTARVNYSCGFGYSWIAPDGLPRSGGGSYAVEVSGDTVIRGDFEQRITAGSRVAGMEPDVHYSSGLLHLTNLEGFRLSVVSSGGRVALQSVVESSSVQLPLSLPAGIYIVSAVRGKERKAFKIACNNL
jgi:hypothetical protein